MFWTGIIYDRTTRIFHNVQCGLLHLSRLYSIMPTARVNDTGCSHSTDRLETDGGQVRDTLKVDHWREKLQTLPVVQVLPPSGGLAHTADTPTLKNTLNKTVLSAMMHHPCRPIHK